MLLKQEIRANDTCGDGNKKQNEVRQQKITRGFYLLGLHPTTGEGDKQKNHTQHAGGNKPTDQP